MSAWWNNKYGKEAICGITHTRLRQGKNVNNLSYVVNLNCNHSFYRTALYEWSIKFPDSLPTCPICRITYNHDNL
jgi:hypothetical protein